MLAHLLLFFLDFYIGADPGHECTLPNSSIINQSLPSMYTDGCCKVLVEIGGVNESQPCPDGYSYGSMFESTILTQVQHTILDYGNYV